MQQARIDLAPDAIVFEPDTLDHRFFQRSHGDAVAKVGNIGWRGVRVDRAADQGQGARLRLWVQFGQVGGGSQRQRRGLAHGDDVNVGPQFLHEIHEVEGVILDIEFAFGHGDVAGIVPIGDVKFGIRQKRLNG